MARVLSKGRLITALKWLQVEAERDVDGRVQVPDEMIKSIMLLSTNLGAAKYRRITIDKLQTALNIHRLGDYVDIVTEMACGGLVISEVETAAVSESTHRRTATREDQLGPGGIDDDTESKGDALHPDEAGDADVDEGSPNHIEPGNG